MEIENKIRNFYPWPIWNLYQSVRLAFEPQYRVQKLVQLVENTTRYLSLVGLGYYNHLQVYDKQVELVRKELEKPSFGNWVAVYRSLMHALSTCTENAFIPQFQKYKRDEPIAVATIEMAKIANTNAKRKNFSALEFLNATTEFRNRTFGHGDLHPKTAEEILKPLEAGISQWLDGLTVLEETTLIYIKRVEYQSPEFVNLCVDLNRGPLLDSVSIKSDTGLIYRRVYLFDKKLEEFIALHPFFFFDEYANNLFLYSRIGKNNKFIVEIPCQVSVASGYGEEPNHVLDVKPNVILGSAIEADEYSTVVEESQIPQLTDTLPTETQQDSEKDNDLVLTRSSTEFKEEGTSSAQKQSWTLLSQAIPSPKLVTYVGGHPLIAQLLAQRGFDTPEKAQAFLNPNHYAPAPPHALIGVPEAAHLLHEAITADQNLFVWGDFDVDGQTSTSLLVAALRKLAGDERVRFHVPNRFSEGHGIRVETLQAKLADPTFPIDLLITCDTGIADAEGVTLAKEHGLTVIVTDHHDLTPEFAALDPLHDQLWGLPVDGGRSDGGRSDGGRSDGGRSDGGRSDGGRSDGGRSDGGRSDGEGLRQARSTLPGNAQRPQSEHATRHTPHATRHTPHAGAPRARNTQPSVRYADAIVNPKFQPADDPLRTLPGVGVAYKLIQQLYRLAGCAGDESELLDLVALGIVADVAEQVNDARYLLQLGLDKLRNTKRIGLRVLMEVARITPETVDADSIGFQLGPRMNALGRLEDATVAVELLTTRDIILANQLAGRMERLNQERRVLTSQITAAAMDMIDREPKLLDFNGLVLAHPNWHAGIVGIVASRLVEAYGKPTVLLLTPPGSPARGSARSITGVDIGGSIAACSHLLLHHGGHPGAAGLALLPENIDLFRRELDRQIELHRDESIPTGLAIDAEAPLSQISLHLAEELQRLAPFGNGNPTPRFMSRHLTVLEDRRIGREGTHRRLTVQSAEGTRAPVIWFNGADIEVPAGPIDLVYTIGINEYRGDRTLQLSFIALRAAEEVTKAPLPGDAPRWGVEDLRNQSPQREALPKPDGAFWYAEGTTLAEGIAYTPRLHAATVPKGQALVLWSSPPSAELLQWLVETTAPTAIYLCGQQTTDDSLPGVLRNVAGMCKYALQRDGLLQINRMAARLGTTEAVIRHSLLWLESRGQIQLAEWDPTGTPTDTVRISPGDGKEHNEERAILQAELDEQLAEVRAYRRFFLRAKVRELGL